jgi:serine/threonine protein phosphatase PrpC
MGIVLDASEISLIAENINHSSDDFDQDIDAIKSAIMAFINHKAMINQSKINELIHEVREVVSEKNSENSQLLSDGLRSINSDIQEANKQFKSNVQKCLTAFAIPAIKAS